MKTIYAIAPIIETEGLTQADTRKRYDPLCGDDVRIVSLFLDRGPSSVENEIDEALCIPNIIEKALWARRQGAAGIFVDCMLDPGVKALRTALDIPVIGPAETAFHLAASLGHKFGIIDIGDDTDAMVQDQLSRLGLAEKFAGLRGTGIAVEHIGHGGDATVRAMSEAALLAVQEDGADILVLGCTGFSGLAGRVEADLLAAGHVIPVIDPVPLAIRTLITLLREGICHGKRHHPAPQRKKQVRGYDLPEFYQTVT